MKKTVSCMLLAMLFVSMFVLAFNVEQAKAQSGTITINPNGSISSSVPANITVSKNVTYTFTGNNYLPIIVNRSNIIINGNGHTLQALGQDGFSLTKVGNVTIKNTAITNSLIGIDLSSSSGNTLSGNNATGSTYGIELAYSSDSNTLSGNNVMASYYGINLAYSSGNVLSDNLMAGNTYNFYVYGSVLSDYVNHVDTSNLVNGKPIYYLMNQSNIVINPSTYSKGVGYLGLVNCKNMTVQGLTLARNGQGLLLAFTNDTEINHDSVTANCFGIDLYSCSGNVLSRNNVTANLYDGIDLTHASGNVLSGNNVTANHYDGIDLYSSSGNVLSGNNVTANTYDGIYLSFSSGNVLSGNNVTANTYDGIYLLVSSGNRIFHNNGIRGNGYGIYLDSSSGNVLSGNTFTANNDGNIWLEFSAGNVLSDNVMPANLNVSINLVSCDNNTLSGNNITATGYGIGYGIELHSSSGNVLSGNNVTNGYTGILLSSSSGNTFYHNNFKNNIQQVESDGSPNTWDNGYPSGGNYWSDYQTRYPSAAEIDGSGIWNTPYVIDANNTDHYPLMTPWTSVETRATPAGKNVTITYATGAVVTFSNVTSSGTTTLAGTQPPTTALTGAPNSLFVSFQTNATYHGNVTLSFKYNPVGLTLAEQEAMRIWLWNTTSNAWRDITTYVNTTTDTVYGVSPHLSVFGITCTLSLLGSNSQTIQTVIQTPSSPPPGLPTSLEALAYYNVTAIAQYSKPVTVQLAYNTSAISPQQAMLLQMWLWNTTSNAWVKIPTRVDTTDGLVIGVSPHLSVFGITTLQPFPAGITMVGAACSKTVVGKGYNVAINVQIQNQGTSTQSFTVFVCANTTVIYSEQISNLAPQKLANVTFEFTANLAYGNYSINACGQPIKWVKVTIPGDVNGDGVVNIRDGALIGEYWGITVPPAPANVDVGGFGVINIRDGAIVGANWGQSITL